MPKTNKEKKFATNLKRTARMSVRPCCFNNPRLTSPRYQTLSPPTDYQTAPPSTPNVSPPLSLITTSRISPRKLLLTPKLYLPLLTSPPSAPTQPLKHSSPLTIILDPVELIFLTPHTSPHTFFESLKDLPPRTTNPPPLRPSFESIEHLANQPSPLLAMKPPLPPLPPQLPPLPPQLPPLGPNNPFSMLTHEIFYDQCQRTQVIINNLREEISASTGNKRPTKCKASTGNKGPTECKASAGNLEGIQVKYIIKEVEDYLKTYSSAKMDIRCRGGSHVTNVPKFDEEVSLVGKIGPYETKDTKIAALRLKFYAFKAIEGEKVNGTFTRLRSLLNDLENNGVSITQAKVNATFVNSLPRKWLSMNQTQRANNFIKNDTLAALYSKYNYEKDSNSNIKEDQRSSSEFLADLNAEFHERDLLANQRRFYKRSGRVGSLKKPLDKTNETCFAYGKLGHFQKECTLIKTSTPYYPSLRKLYNKPKFHTNTTPQHNQHVNNNQKDYRVKYKGLKAKIAVLTKKIDAVNKGKSKKGLIAEPFNWDEESVSSDDKGVTKFKALMAVVDELSVGKADARSGQWVEITMNKVQKLLSITDSDERKHVLDYTHVDLHYVKNQRKNLLSKAIGRKDMGKEQNSSKEVVFTKSGVLTSETYPKKPSNSELEGNSQKPIPTIPKLFEAEPSGHKRTVLLPTTTQTTNKVVKGLKEQIQTRSETSPPTSESGCS
nr:hypothetical protein [Tanacetum cinerariifolium]